MGGRVLWAFVRAVSCDAAREKMVRGAGAGRHDNEVVTRVPDPRIHPHPMQPWALYPPARPKCNALAVTSFVLGVVAMIGLGPVTGIPAIITGVIGRRRVIDSAGRQTGTVEAVLGIVLGVAGTVIVVLAVAWLYLILLAAGAGEPPRR